MNDQAAEEVSDKDKDSLHILPLTIVPIETPALRRARLIKSVRLESVVEMFTDVDTGSGQLEVEGLPKEFGWPETPPHVDLLMLRSLALLPSYDVYSLRLSLREQGIEVDSQDSLKLSAGKSKELSEYMSSFTRPLIAQIYGGDDVAIQDFADVINLFRDPDVSKAREKLNQMAEKLNIDLGDVPKFLEDYGDIFLSLSYYRQCLDEIEPFITDFLDTMVTLKDNYQLKSDQNLMKTCKDMEAQINGLMASVTGRFENFDRNSEGMWENLTAERFRKVKDMIESFHTTTGGVLCSLSVKMNAWARLFPNKDAGGPVRRSEFMMSDMKQGMDKIQKMEDSAPMLAGLD